MLTENLRNRRGAVKPEWKANDRHVAVGHDRAGRQVDVLFARDVALAQFGHDRVQVGASVQSRLLLLNASRRRLADDKAVRGKVVPRAEAVRGISAR